MNKGISFLLLFVVLSAMGLVMFSHITAKEDPAPVQASAEQDKLTTAHTGRATPMTAPQDGSGGLRPIEPPLNSAPPADRAGSAVPVSVSADGSTVVPPANVQKEMEAKRLAAEAKAEQEKAEKAKAEEEKALLAKAEEAKSKAGEAKAKAEKDRLAREKQAAAAKASNAPGLEPLANLGGSSKTQNNQQPAAAAQSTPAPAKPGVHTLKGISMSPAGSGVRLAISADSPFQCKTFVLDSPPRLVIDLPGSWKGMQPPAAPQSALIKKVRLGKQAAGPRLVLDLNGPVKHRVERNGNMVNIVVQ